jgi:hypothetical protein
MSHDLNKRTTNQTLLNISYSKKTTNNWWLMMEYRVNFILAVHPQHWEQLLHGHEFLNMNNLIFSSITDVGTNFLHVNLSSKTDPVFS